MTNLRLRFNLCWCDEYLTTYQTISQISSS